MVRTPGVWACEWHKTMNCNWVSNEKTGPGRQKVPYLNTTLGSVMVTRDFYTVKMSQILLWVLIKCLSVSGYGVSLCIIFSNVAGYVMAVYYIQIPQDILYIVCLAATG